MLSRRLVPAVALVAAFVGLLAAPAGAAPILADDDYKWFYWAAPLLVVSLLGMVALIGLGYYVRVLRPKWRGRQPT